MRISYDGKVAVVVGATSGIGRATAMAFAEAGAKVVFAGRREHEGAEAVREIEATGGEATFVRTDVTSEEQVAALMDAAVTTYGGLDCAFNNAGRESNLGVADATVEDFEAEVDTNTRGVLLCLNMRSASCASAAAAPSSTTARCPASSPRPRRHSTG